MVVKEQIDTAPMHTPFQKSGLSPATLKQSLAEKKHKDMKLNLPFILTRKTVQNPQSGTRVVQVYVFQCVLPRHLHENPDFPVS